MNEFAELVTKITADGGNLDLDFIDHPTGWAIQRNLRLNHVHKDCSALTSDGALLCDCDALALTWADIKNTLGVNSGPLVVRYLNFKRSPVPAPCGCTPGTDENGWHEARSPECIRSEHERFARAQELCNHLLAADANRASTPTDPSDSAQRAKGGHAHGD